MSVIVDPGQPLTQVTPILPALNTPVSRRLYRAYLQYTVGSSLYDSCTAVCVPLASGVLSEAELCVL